MKKILLILISTSLMLSCSSSSDDAPSSGGDNFDRAALLTHVADNIIIPAFQDLDAKLSTLKSQKETFVTTPNQTNLEALRSSWLEAYKVWQYVEKYNIGKAEALFYNFKMNIYPSNTGEIEAYITSDSYNLATANNFDAIGFPALDYMLYGIAEDDAEIIVKYSDSKYLNYLSEVVDLMDSLTKTVLDDWTSNYRATFISQANNTATSALNKLTNDFVYYYEKGFRANKIGIPAGNFSATPLPDKVEGYYSKIYSKTLALEALKAVEDKFNGKAYNTDTTGESFKTYLIALGREDLVNSITSHFSSTREKLYALSDNFVDQINTDNTKNTQAYDAIQKAVVLLKVDMLQAFNISVDYIDSDGD